MSALGADLPVENSFLQRKDSSLLRHRGGSRSQEYGHSVAAQGISAFRPVAEAGRRSIRGGDGLADYLLLIRRVPLLNSAEEVLLGRLVQEWLSNPNPCRLIERRGMKARDRMVSANLRLVVMICKRYQGAIAHLQLDLLDLIQAGNLGLIKAVERFDPTRGYKLSTFAFWWIRQSVQRAMRELGAAIRIPRSMAQLAFRAHDLQAASDTPLSMLVLAEKLGEEQRRLERSLHVVRQCRTASLDEPITAADGNSTLLDTIRDGRTLQPHDDYQWLHEQLKALSERERRVLELRYQVSEGYSLRQVAVLMGLTKSQVQGIERKAFSKLRSRLTTVLNPSQAR